MAAALGLQPVVDLSGPAAVARSGWPRKTPASWPQFLSPALLLAAVLAARPATSSYPALRVREVYLAMVLLIVAEISRSYVRANDAIACGAHGLVGIPNPLLWIDNPTVRGLSYAGIVLAIAGFMYFIAQRLVDAPFGRVLKAVRGDELAARVLGKREAAVKGQVMAIGSAMAVVAGALYAFHAVRRRRGLHSGHYVQRWLWSFWRRGNHKGVAGALS